MQAVEQQRAGRKNRLPRSDFGGCLLRSPIFSEVTMRHLYDIPASHPRLPVKNLGAGRIEGNKKSGPFRKIPPGSRTQEGGESRLSSEFCRADLKKIPIPTDSPRHVSPGESVSHYDSRITRVRTRLSPAGFSCQIPVSRRIPSPRIRLGRV